MLFEMSLARHRHLDSDKFEARELSACIWLEGVQIYTPSRFESRDNRTDKSTLKSNLSNRHVGNFVAGCSTYLNTIGLDSNETVETWLASPLVTRYFTTFRC
jgi:hypothetical protein